MKPKQFIKKQYLTSSFKERVLPELTDDKSEIKLQECTLKERMNDTQLKEITKSTPINVKYFASIIQDFVKTADKSMYFILHIKTSKEVVAVPVGWSGDEWDFGADGFDYDWWPGDLVFLFPATDSLDSLTLCKKDIEDAYNKGREDVVEETKNIIYREFGAYKMGIIKEVEKMVKNIITNLSPNKEE